MTRLLSALRWAVTPIPGRFSRVCSLVAGGAVVVLVVTVMAVYAIGGQ